MRCKIPLIHPIVYERYLLSSENEIALTAHFKRITRWLKTKSGGDPVGTGARERRWERHGGPGIETTSLTTSQTFSQIAPTLPYFPMAKFS